MILTVSGTGSGVGDIIRRDFPLAAFERGIGDSPSLSESGSGNRLLSDALVDIWPGRYVTISTFPAVAGGNRPTTGSCACACLLYESSLADFAV